MSESKQEDKSEASEFSLFKQVLRRLFPYAWRYRWRMLGVLGLSAVVALFSKGLVLFIDPVLQMIFTAEPSAAPAAPEAVSFMTGLKDQFRGWFLEFCFGQAPPIPPEAQYDVLFRIFTIIFVVTVVAALSQYLYVILARNLGLKMIVDLRRDVCSHLLRLSMKYHGKRKMGDLLSRLTTDADAALRSVNIFFEDLLQLPFMILLTFGTAFYASPILTFSILILIPVVAFPISFFARKVRRGSYRSATALGSATSAMEQMLSGIRVVKAFQMEDKEIENIDQANRNFMRRTMQMIRAKGATRGFLIFFTMGGTALALLGIALLEFNGMGFGGEIGLATIFMGSVAMMYAHIRQLTRFWFVVLESSGAALRLFEILDRRPEIITHEKAEKISAVQEGLAVRDLTFAYEEEKVLDGVTFQAPAGTRVALVGPSGAGKSTLLDLIARFYDPTGGALTCDGKDLRSIQLDSWLRQIAIVSQEPFLFNTTIRENIRYGKLDASDGEIEEAARAAHIHDFVSTLPEGYETVVGERGTRLSGGQLQRITIARAILKNASVLLLDEATSSLDAASEKAVQEALDTLMEGKTTFIIAHRLSTVRHADLILVLDRGRIVEQGNHQELLQKGGLYRRLYDMQFAESATA